MSEYLDSRYVMTWLMHISFKVADFTRPCRVSIKTYRIPQKQGASNYFCMQQTERSEFLLNIAPGKKYTKVNDAPLRQKTEKGK